MHSQIRIAFIYMKDKQQHKKSKAKKSCRVDKGLDEVLDEAKELPLIGGIFKGLEKLVGLAEKVEKAGGEIKQCGQIKGKKGEIRGAYGFFVKTGLGEKSVLRSLGHRGQPKKSKQKDEVSAENNMEEEKEL